MSHIKSHKKFFLFLITANHIEIILWLLSQKPKPRKKLLGEREVCDDE